MPKPEKIFMIGPCKAAIFRNIIVKNGEEFQMPKVKFEIRFKDKRSGKWKGTSCMTLPEISKAILVLQKAYEYLVTQKFTRKSRRGPTGTLSFQARLGRQTNLFGFLLLTFLKKLLI